MGSDARKSLQGEDPGCQRAAPPYPTGVGATRSAHHWRRSQAVAYTSLRVSQQVGDISSTNCTNADCLPVWLLNVFEVLLFIDIPWHLCHRLCKQITFQLLLTVCVVIGASFFRLKIQAGFLSYAVYDSIGLLQYNWPTTVQIFMYCLKIVKDMTKYQRAPFFWTP
jgi:hypothetical protein